MQCDHVGPLAAEGKVGAQTDKLLGHLGWGDRRRVQNFILVLVGVARRGSCNSMLKILQLCTVALVAVAVVAALAFASVLVDGCD